MEILSSETNKNLVLNSETTFITNVGWEDNVKQYEDDLLQSIINPMLNFETVRFGHAPYTGSTGIKQNDVWFYFYFYSDSGGTVHNGGLNYEYVGLSLDENVKLTVNTTESFFRLDFYKIPLLSGSTLDYINKRLVFTKNLRLPLGEKIYYTPVNDYIHVPVFMGSNYRNEENMYIYWFIDDSVLSDSTLTGNTFYMTARYYNSIDGKITSFTKSSMDIDDIPTESGDTYYKITLDRNNNTYDITGSGRYGVSNNPVMFYSHDLPNSYDKYVDPLNVDVSFVSPHDDNPNNGYINITIYNGKPNYTYKLYTGSTQISTITISGNTHQFNGLNKCESYYVMVVDSDGKQYTSDSVYLECLSYTYITEQINYLNTQVNI